MPLPITKAERVAFSPGEFAALFGKSQTWGYRQIYAGKVKAITEHGRILIPAGEVELILQTAGVYDGLKSKEEKTKPEIQRLAPKLQTAWQSFLNKRKQTERELKPNTLKNGSTLKHSPVPAGRQAALARLAGQRKNPKTGSKRT